VIGPDIWRGVKVYDRNDLDCDTLAKLPRKNEVVFLHVRFIVNVVHSMIGAVGWPWIGHHARIGRKTKSGRPFTDVKRRDLQGWTENHNLLIKIQEIQ
jgi:hypothetical protein